MNYFGPHEHSIIDFTKLDESPIFLIGGDTGAGKSTIFDAMTFALFGSTTGDREPKEMRSQFAPDDKATEVTFYFEQGNLLYKITRTPEQWLAKKNGDGLTKKATTAKLSTVDKIGGIETDSLASKPVDVGHMIDDILNLNAQQFKKIILLPQNDFSEFLKASTDDKETILKKIFGTQLYSNFTTKLKAKYNEANSESEKFNTELDTQIGSSAWTDEEREKLQHEAIDQTVPILEKFLEEHKSVLQQNKKEKDTINATVKKADADSQVATDLHNKFNNLDELKKKYQKEITDKTNEMKAQQLHLDELKWAEPLKDTVRDLDSKNSEYHQKTLAKEQLDQQLSTAKDSFETAQTKVDELTKKTSEDETNQARISKLTAIIPQVKSLEDLQKQLTNLNPQVDTLKADLQKQTDTADEIRSNIKDKTTNLVPIDKLQNDKDILVKSKDNFVETLTPLKNKQHNLTNEVTKIETNLSDLNEELSQKTAIYESTKKDYETKIVRRQDLMIAQLQKELKDGEQCVVCGSTDHSHMVSKGDANEEELKELIENIDNSQKAYAAADDSLKTVKRNVAKTTKELADKKQELESAKTDLTAKYNELVSTSDLTFNTDFSLEEVKNVFNKAIDVIDIQLKDANKLAKEIQKLNDDLVKLNKSIADNQANLSAKKSEVKTTQATFEKTNKTIDPADDRPSAELIKEHDQLKKSSDEYHKQLDDSKKLAQDSKDQFAKYQTQSEDAKNELSAQKKAIEKLNKSLKFALSADNAKTNDESVLNSWITEISQDKLTQIQKDLNNYNRTKEILAEDIQKATDSVADKVDPDIVKIQQVLSELKTQRDAVISKVAKIEQAFELTQDSFNKIKQIMSQQAKFATTLADITSLYNVISGKDGNDNKLKLETYVVQNYLKEILNYANDNFIGELSNNRYSFEIASEGSDKRTDHGLDISVYDNETNDSRSTKTLSGGETFIAALSIALSLSEVVQSSANGVQIDALFVDEGFGSLDQETLDKAMDALEHIGENRMVGVISHIDSMKNSIGQQVLIKKIGDGRSKVELINK